MPVVMPAMFSAAQRLASFVVQSDNTFGYGSTAPLPQE
jgi:hypothetical protein